MASVTIRANTLAMFLLVNNHRIKEYRGIINE